MTRKTRTILRIEKILHQNFFMLRICIGYPHDSLRGHSNNMSQYRAFFPKGIHLNLIFFLFQKQFSCHFYQHFVSSCYASIFAPKKYKAKLKLKKSWAKYFCTSKVSIKCWWNWHQVSISSTFFARIFRTKCRFDSFFLVTCTLKKLPKRHSYEKRARKTLMKLTAGGRKCAKKYNVCFEWHLAFI